MSIDTTTTAGKIAVMQASAEGKAIQSKRSNSNDEWVDNPIPYWYWGSYDYRIAPEPPKKKLVPWEVTPALLGKRLKAKDSQHCTMIVDVWKGRDSGLEIGIGDEWISAATVLAEWLEILPDGTEAPCGVEVTE